MSKIFGLFTCFSSKKNKQMGGSEEAKRTIQDKPSGSLSASKNARVLPHFSAGDENFKGNACSRCGQAIEIPADIAAAK